MEFNLGNITLEVLVLFSINLILIFIILSVTLSNRSKIKRLKAKYNRFMSGLSDDTNIEELLYKYMDRVDEVSEKNREVEHHMNSIERNMLTCIQKIGIVRFNAYDNVGSDLSYSVALLDSNDCGVVLSGLFSRDSSLNYAKPITNGNSKYALSAEEIQALEIAKKSSREKMY